MAWSCERQVNRSLCRLSRKNVEFTEVGGEGFPVEFSPFYQFIGNFLRHEEENIKTVSFVEVFKIRLENREDD